MESVCSYLNALKTFYFPRSRHNYGYTGHCTYNNRINKCACHRHKPLADRLLCLCRRRGYRRQCTLSYKTIGQAIGASNNTVRKYVLELEAAGLIATNRTMVLDANGKERNGSLRYTILPVQNAMELYHQRQLAALDAAAERQRVKKHLSASATKGGAAL